MCPCRGVLERVFHTDAQGEVGGIIPPTLNLMSRKVAVGQTFSSATYRQVAAIGKHE